MNIENNIQPSTERFAELGKPVVDPSAWLSHEMLAKTDWAFDLTMQEIEGLEQMIAQVREIIGSDPGGLLNLDVQNFDLGVLREKLSTINHDLKDGVGFALLRGLPVEKWDRLDSCIAYWGIGRHIGRAASNNGLGDMLGHVINQGKKYDDPNFRAYQTKETLDFHNDQTDVVTLLCLRVAKSGGFSKITSVVSVFNALLERRPDLAKHLYNPMWVSRNNEIAPGQKPWYEIPVFNFMNSYLSVCAGTKYIEKGHNLPGAPKLTDSQREALALLDQLFEDLHMPMEFRPGDIQILNNYVNVHTRTEFDDWPGEEQKRHLWRMWLVNENLRPLTEVHKTTQHGIWVPESSRRITLMPEAI